MMVAPSNRPQFVVTDYGTEYRYGCGDYPAVEKIGYTTYRDGHIVVDVHGDREVVPWVHAKEIPVSIELENATITFDGTPRITDVTYDQEGAETVEVEVYGYPYTVSA